MTDTPTASPRANLDALLDKAREWWRTASPEEKRAMHEAQRESWVRGEMGLTESYRLMRGDNATTAASPAAREVSRQPFERHEQLAKHIARMASAGHVGSLIEWIEFIAALNSALDAYAAPLREEIEALRADCVIKVANARLAAHEEVPDWVYGVLDELSDCTPAYISMVIRDKDFDRALAQEGGNG